ncbi:hypothetical protein LMG27198_32100 [Methylocystis echinoides]|jgi:hypothetical protein|uniref:Uncharacterized protein n=1 Tax=Methylocystis echinoides TaxID=29468 RepID=A0A9W6GWG6_9HYPH|nr:hypothetical protein LMG27198_32100 [Methylocystis echinoides]
MRQGSESKARKVVTVPPERVRRERAILRLWSGLALIDDECARTLVVSAICCLAENRAEPSR